MITTVLIVFLVWEMPHSIAFNLVCHFLYLDFGLIGYILPTAAEEIYNRGWLIPTISYHTNALSSYPDLSYYVLLLPYE